MKKPLILFAVLFVLGFGIFASIEIEKVDHHASISKSPGFAPAIPEGMTKITRKRSVKYQINYAYEVAGTSYKIDSANMSEEEAKALLTTPSQVVYDTKAPAVAVMKSEFDHIDPKESKLGALLTAAGIGFFIALVGSLFLSWKFGWFKRGA